MGGGDLNLKKSWHPSTLRNIERVWKAEQKHEAEKQKIEQLQKELAEERAREEIQTFAQDQGVIKKKEEKLDWMYQGPSAMVNREDFLLGKKIDKTYETMQLVESGKAPEEEASDVSTSVFNSQNLSGTATVDLANKIREDPLFNIMKKEKEQRKNLLTNPVKMKQLQQMLKASLKEKSKKKNKKSKKKKHHSSDSDEDPVQERKKYMKHNSSDSDDEDAPQKRKKHKKRNSSDSDDEDAPQKRKKHKKRNSSDSDDEDASQRRRKHKKRNSSDSDEQFSPTEYGKISKTKHQEYSPNQEVLRNREYPNHRYDSKTHSTTKSSKSYYEDSQSYRNSHTDRYRKEDYSEDRNGRYPRHGDTPPNYRRNPPSLKQKECNTSRRKEYSSPNRKEYSSPIRKEYSSPNRKECSSPKQKEYNSLNRKDYNSQKQREYTSPKQREYTSPNRKEFNSPKRRRKENSSSKYNCISNGASDYHVNNQKYSDKEEEPDAEETERLLKEMQENAKWREKQRKKNTERYRKEDERENNVKYDGDASNFLKPMLSKAAGKGSLENRVKQKIFSIQRSGASMDKNFARRE